MNSKILFNSGWEFAKSDLSETKWENLKFDPVDLPHDWLIYNTLDLYEDSIGWYRKNFEYQGDAEQILLYFDGVYMDSTLFVNGQLIGEWKYGYSSFEHDLTAALQIGKNEIVLKVVHQSPNSRWYSGAGIYRNVWLKKRRKTHLVTDGIYFTPRLKGGNRWEVLINTELRLIQAVFLRHTILYHNQEVARTEAEVSADQGDFVVNSQVVTVDDPLLWGPDEPNLYQLKTELFLKADNERIKVEEIKQNLGFRHVVMDPEEGFILNGRKMKLNGVCEHHDFGALGAAFNQAALQRRFKLLKEMGANAIRTAHNMPAVELMNLADEMGFLVVSEAFDMWEYPKTKYDYARFFNDWAAKDIRSWVRRDRNHPSLIMWSIGNEISDTHASERGQEITRMLRDFVREHDPRENGRVTIGSNYMPWPGAQKCADLLKVVGYNYAEKYYHEHHAKYPDWVIYGSETASVLRSRGIYHFPLEQPILADENEQCSSLGNSITSWGAKSTEACIIADRDAPFSLGQFIWTGFDYLGEPTPYQTKNSYFGQLDTATFPKDSYYIFQSAWTDYKTNPFVHLFPYWDFNKGQIIDVQIASNAPRVELRLNGESIGTHTIDHGKGEEIVGWWKVPYVPGEIKAIAYNRAGEIIAEHSRRSFGDAVRLKLKADKKTMNADGTDLLFVEISAEDQNGYPVENATNRINVEVKGAGRLLGLDNGDSTDYDQFKGLSKRLFGGKLMAIIGARLEPGEVVISVESPGLTGASLRLQALPCEGGCLQEITADMENRAMPLVMGAHGELPVRKIAITSPAGQKLSPEKKQVTLYASLYPAGASYQEVEWSVVNDLGLVSHLAKIEGHGREALLTALGDGEFRVRCTSKNGTDKIKLISELEFSATGLGLAHKDPYQFIAGGLYDYSEGEVGPGNEGGFAAAEGRKTVVSFKGLDFGLHGSDTITLPIFGFSHDPYKLEIWEGIPGEKGSRLLKEAIYHKKSIWNIYQSETYQLPKRLKGVTTLSFICYDKLHLKGFSFAKQNRAFRQNLALDCDQIYGDSFTKTAQSIADIGNNVSLEYRGMDFGQHGAGKLIIYGRGQVDNSIQVRFTGGEVESIQLFEFAASPVYVAREFELARVKGKQKVTFVFLPGSNFDFGWFQFKP